MVVKYLSIADINLWCDSQLVAAQPRGEYEAKNKRMEQYLQIMHVLRTKNQMTDELANLATRALRPCNVEISVMD